MMTFKANEIETGTTTIPTGGDSPAGRVRSRRNRLVMRHRSVGVRISGFGI